MFFQLISFRILKNFRIIVMSGKSLTNSFSYFFTMSKVASKEPQRKSCFKKNFILILTISAVVAGVAVGMSLRIIKLEKEHIDVIGFPGELLMNMFKMIVVPLVITSLIVGMGNIDPKQMGKLGGTALVFFAVTTLLSALLGVVVVSLIHPGDPDSRVGSVQSHSEFLTKNRDGRLVDTLMDIVRNALPDNLFGANMESAQTTYVHTTVPGSNGTANETTRTIKVIKVESMNIMGWVVISLLIGAIVGHLRRDGRPVLRLVIACDKVINKMVMLIIYYSPFGVLFLIAEKILRIDNVSDLAKVLGMFIFVDVLVQFILFILLLFVYVFFTRKNPLKLVAGFSPSIAMAIGTSASTACLPVSLKCMEERMGISKTICRLVLPVGATINMNGTAAHLAVSSLFIAQLNGSAVAFGQYAVVLLTSSIAAAATAGVSSASLFTMIIVLSAINQPIEDISLLVSVDWFVNRFRVINNVFGDAVCACVLEHYYGAKLLKEEEEESGKDVGTTESKDTERSSKSASTRTEATQCSNDEEEA